MIQRRWILGVFAIATSILLAGCDGSGPSSSSEPFSSIEKGSPPLGPYIIVLGTAQDGGVPQLGSYGSLDDAVRYADPPRLVSSLMLCDPRSGSRWLFDATPDIRKQIELAEGHPKTRSLPSPRPPLMEGVFLTHAHMGHYTGLMHLGRESYGAKAVPVYATPIMIDYLSSNGPWNLLVKLENIVLRPMNPGESVSVAKDLVIDVLSVPHRNEYSDTVAFIIRGPERSLLFLPDIDKWDQWDRSFEEVIKSVDYALVDGSFFTDGEIPGRDMSKIPHPLMTETMKRAQSLEPNDRKKIHFIHLNHTNPALDPNGDALRKIKESGLDVTRELRVYAL